MQSNVDPREYLSAGALAIWDRVMKDTPQSELDNMDMDILAMFCDAVDKYNTLDKIILSKIILSESLESTVDGDAVKKLRGWTRIILSCADKLGFTPRSRKQKIKCLLQ